MPNGFYGSKEEWDCLESPLLQFDPALIAFAHKYRIDIEKNNGRITWTKHYVCCCDGVVYDPMLEEPVGIEQYSARVFGEEFPMERWIPKEAMVE